MVNTIRTLFANMMNSNSLKEITWIKYGNLIKNLSYT